MAKAILLTNGWITYPFQLQGNSCFHVNYVNDFVGTKVFLVFISEMKALQKARDVCL